ncbi:hypothetical protein GH714_026972 [Hevea brasiliensis]|uniref:Glycosyltransferase 2-like domain-containing protein n=1 Tax=Hevea brasiliensis TaxID=3981 RepID=A0A6A6K771_HEVBR|nr:hypothetical protein GH714_026972 [Hevea brasiliensis]
MNPQHREFQEWWNKQRQFLDQSDDALLTVEIRSPTTPDNTVDKGHTRSARQLSWLWLLKFQQLASSLAWFTNALFYILRTANRRIASPDSLSDSSSSRLPPSVESAEAMVERVYATWLEIRANYLAPPLQSLTNVCIVLFLIQSVDRALLVLGCFWIKVRKLKPVAAVEYGNVDGESVEAYPMVLVQIPMCNEREVYQQSIAAVCIQDWPKERMLIQVLDDSDELDVQLLIKAEVQKWQQRGVHILYTHRLIRTGYKAGNLKSAMTVIMTKALEDCGGWMERTTVEDMDIAVRAHLCGWKFIYLNDVKVRSGELGQESKFDISFFLLRKLILPFYSFTLFCIILPLTMFLPEAQLPAWVVCYVPGIMSILNILPSPRSFPFIVPYLLFENTMSVTKFNAMISGLFRFGSSYEWIVTKKLGRSSEADLIAFAEKESDSIIKTSSLDRSSSDSGLNELSKLENKKAANKRKNRLYRKELALALILLTASVRSLLSAQGIHFYFLLFQGISFLVVGLDLIGEQVS